MSNSSSRRCSQYAVGVRHILVAVGHVGHGNVVGIPYGRGLAVAFAGDGAQPEGGPQDGEHQWHQHHHLPQPFGHAPFDGICLSLLVALLPFILHAIGHQLALLGYKVALQCIEQRLLLVLNRRGGRHFGREQFFDLCLVGLLDGGALDVVLHDELLALLLVGGAHLFQRPLGLFYHLVGRLVVVRPVGEYRHGGYG